MSGIEALESIRMVGEKDNGGGGIARHGRDQKGWGENDDSTSGG